MMEDFRYYLPEDVIYVNLRETAAKANMLFEQELAHLQELAEQITLDMVNSPNLSATLRDLTPAEFDHPTNALPPNMPLLQSFTEIRKNIQHVILCMEIRKKLREMGRLSYELFLNDREETVLSAVKRIAYQKSSYADAAYLRFAEILSMPRAVNTHSFQSACEDVFNGLCEYCILPLENTSEGHLHTFSRLIDRYGLKIAATCDITASDGSRTTKFALLQKALIPILLEEPGVEQYLEIFLLQVADPSPSALLQAAEFCGLKLHRVDSRPQSDSHNFAAINYVFEMGEGDLFSYLLYLSIIAPEHEIVGFYPHLPQKTN